MGALQQAPIRLFNWETLETLEIPSAEGGCVYMFGDRK